MRHIFAALFMTALASSAATREEIAAARADVLKLSSTWAAEGFKKRDRHWSGELDGGEPRLLQVNLFAGNHYKFSAATHAAAKGLKIEIFTESGNPMPVEHHSDGPRATAGFSPAASGPYFIRLSATEASRAPFCLIYSYK